MGDLLLLEDPMTVTLRPGLDLALTMVLPQDEPPQEEEDPASEYLEPTTCLLWGASVCGRYLWPIT